MKEETCCINLGAIEVLRQKTVSSYGDYPSAKGGELPLKGLSPLASDLTTTTWIK